MKDNELRDERAFEGLIVETLRREDGESLDIRAIRPPNEKEKAALRRVDNGFVEALVRGDFEGHAAVVAEETEAGFAMAGEDVGGELFRTDGVDEELAEELDKIDREIIERKKKEQDDGQAS